MWWRYHFPAIKQSKPPPLLDPLLPQPFCSLAHELHWDAKKSTNTGLTSWNKSVKFVTFSQLPSESGITCRRLLGIASSRNDTALWSHGDLERDKIRLIRWHRRHGGLQVDIIYDVTAEGFHLVNKAWMCNTLKHNFVWSGIWFMGWIICKLKSK